MYGIGSTLLNLKGFVGWAQSRRHGSLAITHFVATKPGNLVHVMISARERWLVNGGRTSERAALRHYNGSPLYWDAVLHLAHRMTTVHSAFREYYPWKLFKS